MRPSHETIEADALLREGEAANFLKLSVRTLQAWRCQGLGPAFCTAGRAIRYRRSDLARWVEAHIVNPAEREAKR